MIDISQVDLGWVAGFLEGEGYFSKAKTSISIQASQVQLEPLQKLQKLLGGSLNRYSQKKQNQNDYYRWGVHGLTAEAIMKLLFPLMSSKRQKNISEAISWYASLPGTNFKKNGRKTCVKRGHPWVSENIGIDYRGKRFCKICKADWQRNRRKVSNFTNSN
jgi:formate dehydrogenase maturation protein FdhE